MILTRVMYLMISLTIGTSILYSAKLDSKTVAIFEGKEKVSLGYFKKLRNEFKKNINSQVRNKVNTKKNINLQVLKMLAEKYVLWKDGLKRGYHQQPKFKSRFLTALRSYFVDYVLERTTQKKKSFFRQNYKKALVQLQAYLLKKYQVKFHLKNSDYKEIFNVSRKINDLKYGEKLPDTKYVPYSRFDRKKAEQERIAEYRNPHTNEIININLRTILDKFSEIDFNTFRFANFGQRINILQKFLSGTMIPIEYKYLSKDDPLQREYLTRIEQNTLAKFYMIIRGVDKSSMYIFAKDKLDLPQITLTRQKMRQYYDKNKSSFTRPKQAEAFIIRLTSKEVDEGDLFIEELKAQEDPYHFQKKQLFKMKKKFRKLRKIYRKTRQKDRKRLLRRKLLDLRKKYKRGKRKLFLLSKKVTVRKKRLFLDKIKEVNKRRNRENGTVKKSKFLGKITYSQEGKLTRYEKFIFMMSPYPFNGTQSILFDSGEGDYVILFANGVKKSQSNFEDSMVQNRIIKTLSYEMRVRKIKNFIKKRLKVVLNKKFVNKTLLKTLK